MTIIGIITAVSAFITGLLFKVYYPKQPPADPEMTYIPPLETEPVPVPEPPKQAPEPIPVVDPALLWDTAKHAYHSTRVICDEMGLTVDQKNIICACIYQESQFLNYIRPGVPTKFENKDVKTGLVWSTDWGICQINDHKGWHIGPGMPFPSVQYVLDNPEKAVRYMIGKYKAGHLDLWSSYKFGHYRQWLKPESPMWTLKS